MTSNKFLKNLSGAEAELNSRIFDLIIGRIFKRIYLNLNEKDKKNIEKVFLSGDSKEKVGIIKKYAPNFKILFKEEGGKIEDEIKTEIEKQF